MSTPLAGPDRSQWATTERRIGRKPRKFRDEFESMLCPEKPFYNKDLGLAEGVGFEPTVLSRVQRFSRAVVAVPARPLSSRIAGIIGRIRLNSSAPYRLVPSSPFEFVIKSVSSSGTVMEFTSATG